MFSMVLIMPLPPDVIKKRDLQRKIKSCVLRDTIRKFIYIYIYIYIYVSVEEGSIQDFV